MSSPTSPAQSSHPPVMVLGCGRSGTSIFGELFDGLGPYDYESEPSFGDVMVRPADKAWAVKVPRETADYPVDPGLSFPLSTLLAAFPSLVIFWIVRHPLDAISSLRVGISKDWRHHPRPPDWQQWLERPLIDRCAHHWNYINQLGYAQVAGKAVVVTFEDMIRDPRRFALEICEYLNLQTAACEEAITAWSIRVQDTNNDKFVEAMTSRGHSRPDHSKRVGRWQENLSTEDVASASAIVAATAENFGYLL